MWVFDGVHLSFALDADQFLKAGKSSQHGSAFSYATWYMRAESVIDDAIARIDVFIPIHRILEIDALPRFSMKWYHMFYSFFKLSAPYTPTLHISLLGMGLVSANPAH